MNKQNLKIVVVILICCYFIGFVSYKILKKETNIEKNNSINITEPEKPDVNDEQKEQIPENVINKIENHTKDTELTEQDLSKALMNNFSSNSLPLSAITEIAKLPANIQDTVFKISEANNIYMLQKKKNKIFLITDNSDNIRHNIEFTEISLNNGHQIHTTLGYNDKMKDSKNDIWEYNEETKLPIRHSKYNSDGDLEFVETWNYDESNPVKYEMKDSKENVISMRKETLQDGTDLRIENLVYDENGNTIVNVSTTYDGQDIKRFTYYNSDDIDNSCSIYSDYTDGQKTKEIVYTSDLKVKNLYTSDYKDGEREDITKWDSNNKELEKYIQIDKL